MWALLLLLLLPLLSFCVLAAYPSCLALTRERRKMKWNAVEKIKHHQSRCWSQTLTKRSHSGTIDISDFLVLLYCWSWYSWSVRMCSKFKDTVGCFHRCLFFFFLLETPLQKEMRLCSLKWSLRVTDMWMECGREQEYNIYFTAHKLLWSGAQNTNNDMLVPGQKYYVVCLLHVICID